MMLPLALGLKFYLDLRGTCEFCHGNMLVNFQGSDFNAVKHFKEAGVTEDELSLKNNCHLKPCLRLKAKWLL